MGTICILLGLITLFLFPLVGGFAATSATSWIAQTFAMPNQNMIIAVVTAAFAFVGLLICISLVMHGVTYIKVNKLYKAIDRMNKVKTPDEQDD